MRVMLEETHPGLETETNFNFGRCNSISIGGNAFSIARSAIGRLSCLQNLKRQDLESALPTCIIVIPTLATWTSRNISIEILPSQHNNTEISGCPGRSISTKEIDLIMKQLKEDPVVKVTHTPSTPSTTD